MSRPLRIEINRHAINHNLNLIKSIANQSRILAVIKSNAYGLGLETVLPALTQADGFGVCQLDEALKLRAMGVRRPIVLMQGYFDESEIPMISKHDLISVLHHRTQLEWLNRIHLSSALQVWVKYDTGMNRLGFPLAELMSLWPELNANTKVQAQKILMTHLLEADNYEKDTSTLNQIQEAIRVASQLQCGLSIGNSAGIIRHKDARTQWVRPGILLYGVSPFKDKTAIELGFKPAMQFKSELISVRQCQKGDRIGYYGTYTCPEDMNVGIVGVGYGDGYPRATPTGTPILVNGIETQVVGVVSMEMTAVDLRSVPNARVGTVVELWGEQLPIEKVAKAMAISPYELLLRAGKSSQLDQNVYILDN